MRRRPRRLGSFTAVYRLFLALRYIVVRPISWISMIGIWITVACAIVTLAIFTGFLRQISDVYRGEAGDVVVTPRGTANYADFERVIRPLDGVAQVAPHLVRPVLMRFPGVHEGGVEDISEKNFGSLIGLDPELDAGTTAFAEYVAHDGADRVANVAEPFTIDRAKLPPDVRELPVVLAGAGLFEDFGLTIGQVIELSTLPDDATIDREEFEPLVQRFVVGGKVRCGHYKNDLTALFAALDVVRGFSRASTDVSEICVKAAPGAEPGALAASVANALLRAGIPGSTVLTWRDRNANDMKAIESQRAVLVILLFFFVLVSCFNVFATMTILVTDKIRDIGILGAMGASPFGILMLFVASGFAMAFVSSIVGAATGAVLAARINQVHDAIWELTGVRIFKPDVYFFDRIPTALDAHVYPLIVIATVAFAVMCAAIPALRASRLDPVRAFRQE
jgi:lipoprotein-releasing system permease protein